MMGNYFLTLVRIYLNSMYTNTSSPFHEDTADAREAESAKKEKRIAFQEYIKKRWGTPDSKDRKNDRKTIE